MLNIVRLTAFMITIGYGYAMETVDFHSPTNSFPNNNGLSSPTTQPKMFHSIRLASKLNRGNDTQKLIKSNKFHDLFEFRTKLMEAITALWLYEHAKDELWDIDLQGQHNELETLEGGIKHAEQKIIHDMRGTEKQTKTELGNIDDQSESKKKNETLKQIRFQQDRILRLISWINDEEKLEEIKKLFKADLDKGTMKGATLEEFTNRIARIKPLYAEFAEGIKQIDIISDVNSINFVSGKELHSRVMGLNRYLRDVGVQ